MAKKENETEEYKLIKNDTKKYKLSNCSLRELLDLKECADIVFTYYDNLARSNYGNYPNGMNKYEDYTENIKKYGTIREDIFKAINDVVDNIE